MRTSVIKASRSRASRIKIVHEMVFAAEKGPDAKQIIALLIIYALTSAASFVGAPGGRALPSHIVIHRELVRMRPQT